MANKTVNKNNKKKAEKKAKRVLIVILLIILLMGITIGFSVLSTSLNINGTSRIKNSGWDVHFENIRVKDGSVKPKVAPKLDSKQLNLTYEVELSKLGDFYEFTVDVRNSGYIDAVLNELPVLTGVSKEQDVYFNYTFAHADGTAIRVGEKIFSGDSETFRVRVELDPNILRKELPKDTQKLELSVSMYYEQV